MRSDVQSNLIRHQFLRIVYIQNIKAFENSDVKVTVDVKKNS